MKFLRKFFRSIFDNICFKLSKYNHYFHSIINKRLCPSIILLELYQKAKRYSTGCQGFLDDCMRFPTGQQVKLVVKYIQYKPKTKLYFLKLSDGWTTVAAIIPQHNELYQRVCQVYVGMKI